MKTQNGCGNRSNLPTLEKCDSKFSERTKCELLKGHSGGHQKGSRASGGFIQWLDEEEFLLEEIE